MNRVLTLLAGLAGVALAGPARADSCASATTQSAMTACAGAELKAADAGLNKTYQEIMRRLRGQDDSVKLLTTAELGWIKFRDAECGFATNLAQGGSAYPMLVAQCRTRMTQERTRQLQVYLTCEEGDLACPVPGK